MMSGDISNVTSPNFAFRLDGFVLKREEVESPLPIIRSTKSTFTLNDEAVRVMNSIADKTEYTVSLVVEEDYLAKYSPTIRDVLSTLPHNRLHIVEDQREVSALLSTNAFDYYVDDDLRRLDLTSSDYAYSLKELQNNFFSNVRYSRRKGR